MLRSINWYSDLEFFVKNLISCRNSKSVLIDVSDVSIFSQTFVQVIWAIQLHKSILFDRDLRRLMIQFDCISRNDDKRGVISDYRY